jgi:hypothetical protein
MRDLFEDIFPTEPHDPTAAPNLSGEIEPEAGSAETGPEPVGDAMPISGVDSVVMTDDQPFEAAAREDQAGTRALVFSQPAVPASAASTSRRRCSICSSSPSSSTDVFWRRRRETRRSLPAMAGDPRLNRWRRFQGLVDPHKVMVHEGDRDRIG